MSAPGHILALNAGSSSLKLRLFAAGTDGDLRLAAKGLLEDVGDDPRLKVTDAEGAVLLERRWPHGTAQGAMLDAVLAWVDDRVGRDGLGGVGHRVVHGGCEFRAPVRLGAETIAAIDALTPLAPLHQPRSLAAVRALAALRPNLAQVACFDTSFHRTLDPLAGRYALPHRLTEQAGIRKYGFHGLSYEYVAGALAARDPAGAGGRTIVAHLGQGASLCAMREGRSLDTTMGFSALDGLVMGTRCGAIDPGVLLYLQTAMGMSVAAVEHMLYRESGLLGVSGVSADVRALSKSREPRAAEALELFAFHVARETAALAATLGGLDAFVFTGGIGENDPAMRAAIAARLGWLGVALDGGANREGRARIDAGGAIAVHVIATDEEVVIARQTAACLGAA